MIELLQHIWIVLVPLILTSSLHMVVVKKQLLPTLNIPVWKKGFGENKTWRGFFFVPLTNGLISFLLIRGMGELPYQPIVLGYILGLCYLLAELPNSFLKRKVGIQPGGHPDHNKLLFFVLDKTDSALGVTLAYYFLSGISLSMAVALFLTNSIAHTLVAVSLVRLKIKSGI